MTKYCPALPLLFLFFCLGANAQTVSTLIADYPGNDGLSIDGAGNIYVNDRGTSFNGTRVVKVQPDGSWENYATGLSSFPVGSIFDDEGNLFVTGFNFGNITRIAPNGDKTIVANGIPGAGGLEMDDGGTLYCSAFSSSQIYKISPGETPLVFASGINVAGPSGLAFDHENQVLYSSNWWDARLFRYQLDGSSELVGNFPESPIGPIILHEGYIYASAPEDHQIFRMKVENGDAEILTGTGQPGYADGDISEATFNGPLGLGFSPTGDTLYVSMDSPTGHGTLRIIDFSTGTGLWEKQGLDFNWDVFPSPSSGMVNISAEQVPVGKYSVRVFDIHGKIIFTETIYAGTAGRINWKWDGGKTSGQYWLQLVSEKGAASKKILVGL